MMRPRVILEEAAADLATGTTRALTWALLLIVLTAPVTALLLGQVRGSVRDAHALAAAGGAVTVLSAPGAVDPAACEALAQAQAEHGMVLAGALRQTSSRHPDALPGTSLPAYDVTPGLVMLLLDLRDGGVPTEEGDVSGAAGTSAVGILLGEEATRTLLGQAALATADPQTMNEGASTPGAAAHLGAVWLDGEEATVAGTYPWPRDGRRQGLSYAAAIPVAATGLFDECWVSSWPPREDLDVLIRGAVASGATATTIEVSRLNTSLGQGDSLALTFSRGPARALAAVLGAVGLVLGWLSIRLRRLEIASDLNAGADRTDLLGKLLLEVLCWTSVPAAVAAGTGVALATGLPAADGGPLLLLALTGAGAILTGPLLGAAAGVLGVRESSLMSYSRDRD